MCINRIYTVAGLVYRCQLYSMNLELLTNATVVDDAIRFVSDRSNEKLKPSASSSNEDNKKEESNEPNYNEEKGQLEEQTSEITTNQVF